MATHCRFFLLLSFVTLVCTQFYVTRKDEEDYFFWESNGRIECDNFSNNTASDDPTTSWCKCLNGRTFSTESSRCESFRHDGA